MGLGNINMLVRFISQTDFCTEKDSPLIKLIRDVNYNYLIEDQKAEELYI